MSNIWLAKASHMAGPALMEHRNTPMSDRRNCKAIVQRAFIQRMGKILQFTVVTQCLAHVRYSANFIYVPFPIPLPSSICCFPRIFPFFLTMFYVEYKYNILRIKVMLVIRKCSFTLWQFLRTRPAVSLVDPHYLLVHFPVRFHN